MVFIRRKYKNRKVTFNGITFASVKEFKYYIYLLEKERKGEVKDIRLQVHYELLPAIWEDTVKHLKTKDKVVRKCVQRKVEYIADFVYLDKQGKTCVVDTKGMRTKEYILKKKMMRSLLGIEIIEK